VKSPDNCGVCGRPLIYGTEEIAATCSFCGDAFPAMIYCPDGHYICDGCHQRGAEEVVREVLAKATTSVPVEILEAAMAHPSVPMHGPDHHAMVPAILVTAAKNAGAAMPEGAVEKALERGSKVPGGWCGFYGACGAAVGVGIAVSVLTEATPLTGDTRSLAIQATSCALARIADRGPRCCKRASRKALEAAVEFLRDRLGINLGNSRDVKCLYVERNGECVREECAYYEKEEKEKRK
jgi:hypothetical protein